MCFLFTERVPSLLPQKENGFLQAELLEVRNRFRQVPLVEDGIFHIYYLQASLIAVPDVPYEVFALVAHYDDDAPNARSGNLLKQAVYERPYENDEALPVADRLRLCETQKLTGRILLRSRADIQALFRITPYYYRSAAADRDKLVQYDTLETEIEFILAEYQKEVFQ